MFDNPMNSDNDEDCSCDSYECSDCMEENMFDLNQQDFEHIYKLIDQSYTKLPILYNSIKQTKLDTDFILSVNNYLDRLKSNIYKDLIRRETLLRNGKNHTRNLISLIRCITKISYEQALEISNDSITSKHMILYTMTAIDYILQTNFPQKKRLFNYILNEFISMWLHENLRVIQEDLSILMENGTKDKIFSFWIYLFEKLESICAINWERLQMIQNYRLTHFNQLIKPTSSILEINKDFILLFGKPLKTTMKKSDIPITLLYSNRTDNELKNIDHIHQIFRKSIAKILLQQSHLPNEDLLSKNKDTFQSSIDEKPTWNIISETHTQSIEPELLPNHPSSSVNQFQITSPSGMIEQQTRSSPDEPINQAPKSSTPILNDISNTEENVSMNISSISNSIPPKKLSSDDHFSVSDKNLTIDSKTILHSEINELINFLTQLANSSSSLQQEKETPSLLKQLESSLKQTNTDPNSIIKKILNTNPQSYLSTEDPLFLAAFTRALRKELEDAEILRKIDRGELNEDSQNIGYLSFETKNILKISLKNTPAGDNIDQDRVFIEVTHDPSRCTPNHKLSGHQYQSYTPSSHRQYNTTEFINPQQSSSSETNNFKQRWHWIRSNDSSLFKDCIITSNSLSCASKTPDKNSYSITIEHNDKFLINN